MTPDATPEPVVLINAFEVPPDHDEQFVREWELARDFLATQPGYIETALHRSLAPNADFRYINVARWRTPADFQSAIQSDGFRKLWNESGQFPNHPALYQVIRR
jgi:heme-degrading monooxygenase HmoA